MNPDIRFEVSHLIKLRQITKKEFAHSIGKSPNAVCRLLNEKESQDSRGSLTPIFEKTLNILGYKLALRPGEFEYDLYEHIRAELRAELGRRQWTINQAAHYVGVTPKAFSRMLSSGAKDKRRRPYMSWQVVLKAIGYELYIVKVDLGSQQQDARVHEAKPSRSKRTRTGNEAQNMLRETFTVGNDSSKILQ